MRSWLQVANRLTGRSVLRPYEEKGKEAAAFLGCARDEFWRYSERRVEEELVCW
jgi:hypothetical protein